ncbi:CU044_2847 family protein [Spirillospora sp. CA-142024]|uniref:CU044_2847 family protein n=1 Tax=Spirillospora sp. CA-142024 TaxID=3240036 RepID=UPI003D8C3727
MASADEEIGRFFLRDGSWATVEVTYPPGFRVADRSGVLEAETSFESALRGVVIAASAAVNEIKNLGPDEVEMEFGVRLNLKAGAVITQDGSGHFNFRLKWARDSNPPLITEGSYPEYHEP